MLNKAKKEFQNTNENCTHKISAQTIHITIGKEEKQKHCLGEGISADIGQ